MTQILSYQHCSSSKHASQKSVEESGEHHRGGYVGGCHQVVRVLFILWTTNRLGDNTTQSTEEQVHKVYEMNLHG